MRFQPKLPKNQETIAGKWALKYPQSKRVREEFGGGKKGLIFCKECGSVYYDKSWHWAGAKKYEKLAAKYRPVYVFCPACKMAQNKSYEGEVILGAAVEPKIVAEALALVKNTGEEARRRDPLDRILAVQKDKEGTHILTSENQLAVRIGKKIKQTFGGELEIIHSHREDLVRVKWQRMGKV